MCRTLTEYTIISYVNLQNISVSYNYMYIIYNYIYMLRVLIISYVHLQNMSILHHYL
jgi:hypothetical protein